MAADLYDRLKQLQAARTRASSTRSATADTEYESRESVDLSVTGVWTEVAPMVLERRTVHNVPGLFSEPLQSLLVGATLDPMALRFMDTETTGLSGGAGTTVFLIGVGRVIGTAADPRLELHQTLLSDFPGEPAFLRRTLSLLGSDTVWVSYNGKAFDARLLETRCIMNGIPPATPVHLDLLTWARRFWGRLFSDCSLTTVERTVLNRGRSEDIPGEQIPERYFTFLESQDTEALEEVVEHHSRDIVSLAHLLVLLESLMREEGPHVPFDRVQVARRIFSSAPDTADLLLRAAIRDEDSDAEWAATLLIHRLRMAGRSAEASALAAQFPLPVSLLLLEEIAKLYEHDLRQPASALTLCDAYARSYPAVAPLLERRMKRLGRKSRPKASPEPDR